jgi:hypothetical protein
MHRLKALSQPVPGTVITQTLDIFWIAIKSYNPAQVTCEPCCAKSDTPKMCANVIDNGTRPNHS